jgi:hypothetical protein
MKLVVVKLDSNLSWSKHFTFYISLLAFSFCKKFNQQDYYPHSRAAVEYQVVWCRGELQSNDEAEDCNQIADAPHNECHVFCYHILVCGLF